MGINLEKLKARQHALENEGNKKSNQVSTTLWRPKAEDGSKSQYTIRFVSTPDGDPFKDLHFHYDINGKSVLCPKRNFDEPCAICEYASSLWRKGVAEDRDDYKKQAKKMFAKQRFIAPVIVRDEAEAFYTDDTGEKVEHGVRWYAFGRQTYKDLIDFCLDDDYGDITDTDEGLDFTLTYDKSSGKSFPETKLKPARRESPLFDNKKKIANVLKTIPEVNELYPRLSPEDVSNELAQMLQVTDDDGEGIEHVSGNDGEMDVDAALAELRA